MTLKLQNDLDKFGKRMMVPTSSSIYLGDLSIAQQFTSKNLSEMNNNINAYQT